MAEPSGPRIHGTGTSPCLACVPAERSLCCSLPGFWGSSSFSKRRGWDQGAGRWEASLVEGVRGLRAGVGCAVSMAGARRVGSEAFSASWSLQDLPLKWEGTFILSEGGSHCWYDTDSPERPRQVEQAVLKTRQQGVRQMLRPLVQCDVCNVW